VTGSSSRIHDTSGCVIPTRMGEPRKKQEQLELPKLDKNGQKRGGNRTGAGRPPKNGFRAGEKHDKRPPLRRYEPVHVTVRVVADLANLRKRDIYHAIRFAMVSVLARIDFRVVHLSMQHG